jgi:hypothetical protein
MNKNPSMLGPNCLALIHKTVPPGGTILELGSGEGTGVLARSYTMYSIEHDPNFMHLYESHYIYAPIRDGWYCRIMIEGKLPARYDALIIDGPPGTIGRAGLLNHLDLFNLAVPIFVDDINREEEWQVYKYLLMACQMPGADFRGGPIIQEDDGRKFGLIHAAERIKSS